ncbi:MULTISPECIES: hypothetical protein, partial [unclassified Streptomyces]
PVREQRLDPRPLRISQRHTQTNDQPIQTKLPSALAGRAGRHGDTGEPVALAVDGVPARAPKGVLTLVPDLLGALAV